MLPKLIFIKEKLALNYFNAIAVNFGTLYIYICIHTRVNRE